MGHVASLRKKRGAGARKNLTQFGHPSIGQGRASLRSDNCPNIPEHCPKWIGIGVRIDRNPQNANQTYLKFPGRARLLPSRGVRNVRDHSTAFAQVESGVQNPAINGAPLNPPGPDMMPCPLSAQCVECAPRPYHKAGSAWLSSHVLNVSLRPQWFIQARSHPASPGCFWQHQIVQ